MDQQHDATKTNNTTQDAVQQAWAERTKQWEKMALESKQSNQPIPTGQGIDPKDIRFEVGPPMTQEEFNTWKAQRAEFMKKNFSTE